MRKIVLSLLLSLVVLSGCGKVSALPQLPTTITIKDVVYTTNDIVVGDQITPGNITIDVKENQNKSLSISYINDNKLYYYNPQTKAFEEQDVSAEENTSLQEYARYNRDNMIVDTSVDSSITLPNVIPDNSLLILNTYPLEYDVFDKVDNKSEITISSDSSEPYDDSWVTTGGKQKVSTSLNADGSMARISNSVHESDVKYFKVGEDLTSGYMQFSCEESTSGKCSIMGLITAYNESGSYYMQGFNIQDIKVGETYTYPIPVTGNMDISINALNVFGKPDPIIYDVTLTMVPEMEEE